MRLLFTSLASPGHLYPLLPLATAAREAGHHVVFATADELLPTIEKAGLVGVAAGISIRQAFAEAQGELPRRPRDFSDAELRPLVRRVLADALPRRFVADLGPVLERERPDLVVYEAGNPGGGLAAKLAGLPTARHGFGRISMDETGAVMREAIAEYAAELGFDESAITGDPFIDICPASAQAPEILALPTRLPLRPVGWNEPSDLPAGIADRDRGRPLVYLTLGTAMGNAEVLREAIAGLAGLPVDVLVAAGPTVAVTDLGEVPPNVRIEAWVPQADLLPHLDLVVHHGGSGTTLGAFGAGLPQLLLPQGADQFSNAEAVLALGVGDRLLGEEVTAAAVAEHARRLLDDPAVHTATARLAAEVAAMPTPAEVADRLPALAG